MSWRDAPDQDLTPLEALRISALKTAPAFEAALMAGVRLAGPTAAYREPIARFARHLGVAYQILNDLDDWQLPQPSGRPGGSDLLHGRPTVLWALALANLPPQDRLELRSLVAAAAGDPDALERGATAGLPSSAVNTAGQASSGTHHSAPADRLERARRLYQQAGVFPQAAALVAKHHARAERPPIVSPWNPCGACSISWPTPSSTAARWGLSTWPRSPGNLCAMNIVHLAAGAGPMYCGSCLHGNTLAAALRGVGGQVLLAPLYTPLRTDEESVAEDRVAFGGINVHLQQRWGLFRHTPWWLDRLLDRPALLRWAGRRGAAPGRKTLAH